MPALKYCYNQARSPAYPPQWLKLTQISVMKTATEIIQEVAELAAICSQVGLDLSFNENHVSHWCVERRGETLFCCHTPTLLKQRLYDIYGRAEVSSPDSIESGTVADRPSAIAVR